MDLGKMLPWEKKSKSTDEVEPGTVVELQEQVDADEQRDKSAEEHEYPTGSRLAFILIALFLATFLTSLDVSILATAIPSITTRFHTTEDIGWYGAAFTLSICVLQPLVGKAFTVFPLKPTFLIFVSIFLIGSIICGVSVNSNMFIVGRAIAGCGASGVFAGVLLIIRTISPLERVPMFTGLIMAFFGLATIIGPVLGGALTERAGWRWCFYINLPLGGITLGILVFFFRPMPQKDENLTLKQKMKRLDLCGCLLFIPSIIMLLLALQWGGEQYPWNSAKIIGLFCGFSASFILFVIWEHFRGAEAMIPFALLGDRSLVICFVTQFLLGSFVASAYYLPEWFQVIKGASPGHSGVLSLPAVISQTIISIVAGVLMSRLGYFNQSMILGNAGVAIANGLYTTFKVNTNIAHIVGYQVIQGFGSGQGLQAGMIGIQAILANKPKLVPVATGVLMFSQYLGFASMMSFAQTVFQNVLTNRLAHDAGLTRSQINHLLDAGTASALKVAVQTMPDQFQAVRLAYNGAITRVFFIPAVSCTLAAFLALGVRWKKIQSMTGAPPSAAKHDVETSPDSDDKASCAALPDQELHSQATVSRPHSAKLSDKNLHI